jgi:hypothetical protein
VRMRRLAAPAALLVTVGLATPAVAAAGSIPHPAASTASGSTERSLASAVSSGTKKTSWSSTSTSRLDQAAADAKAARAAAGSGSTIYVASPTNECTSDSGNDGSAAKPYCSIQDAVDAASAGDTISIATSEDYEGANVDVSDLTFVGTSGEVTVQGSLIFRDVTGDSISGLVLMDEINIIGSSDISIDSNEFTGATTIGAVTVDGASSHITVSRNTVNAQGSNGAAIQVAAGASDIDIASNAFAPFNEGAVAAAGVSGIDVVGNTIQRGCGGGVILTGATTDAYVENNVLEDANSDVDYAWIGGLKSTCTTWAPDITADSTAAAGTMSDYNDFYSWGSDDTAAYSWAGVTYQTPSAFSAAVSQGAHDTVDTVESAAISPNLEGWGDPIQAALQPGSAAIGSASTSAPGALTSDLYGVTPYPDRGAVAVDSDDVTVSATVAPWVYDDISSALSLEVDPTGSGTFPISHYDVAWGDGSSTDQGYEATHTYAQAGTYSVVVTAVDTHGRTASTTVQATVAGSDYTPYGPVRILDSRSGNGAPEHAVAADGVVKLQVTGAGTADDPIPDGITAVVMNVTVVSPTQNGLLAVYPDENSDGSAESLPGTSNLNFAASQTVPNLVTVPVGPNGVVDLYNHSAGSTQLLADVVGYYRQQAASQYVSVTPWRILDTRSGTGVSGSVKGRIPAGGDVTINVSQVGALTDPNDVPTVTAVAINITAIAGTAEGVITAYPTGEPLPIASNVNYPPSRNIANMAIVPVGADGEITFHNNSAGTVDVAADLDGYFTTTTGFAAGTYTAAQFKPSAYLPVSTPYRWLDTRQGNGPLVGGDGYQYPFTDDEFIDGVVLNATVVAPTANGYLTLFPDDPSTTIPTASNINFVTGQNTPNMAIVSPGTFEDPGGKYYIAAYLSGSGQANLVADVFGLFEYE